jgi:putative aldouronate transport system substrate-binding protein
MKKSLFIAAALLLTVSLPVFSSGSSQQSSGTQVSVSAPGVLPITREKSTLDVFMYQTTTIDLMGNTVLEEFEKATNVHLNITSASDGAQEKLNLLLNSGQYPEVIIGMNFPAADMVKYGTTENILLPLNDLIEQQGVNIKAYFQKYPWVKEAITSPDGNIYGIPAVDSGAKALGHVALSIKLWLNAEWLNRLGLQKPTTTDEFREVLRAFKTRDPNGNGLADEIPLTGAYAAWNTDPYIFLLNAFGYYDGNTTLVRNGIFTPIANQDYIREGLQYIKSLYDEGLIDTAAFTQPQEQMYAVSNNAGIEIVGAYPAGHAAMGVDNTNIARSRMYTTLEPLRGPAGYRALPFNGDEARPTSAIFVITDKCKNPALALKWADAYCTDYWTVRGQNGVKGTHWTDADPGTFGADGVTLAKYKYLPRSYGTGGQLDKDRLDWSLRLLENNWKGEFQVSGDIYDPSNYEARLLQETIKLVPYASDIRPVPPLAYSVESAARVSQLNAPISDYMRTSIAEFITGRRSLDTNGWNTYKQELERLGYSELIKIMQDTYNAQYK